MNKQTTYVSDIAFTPSVKAIQARKGSRRAYARMETGPGWSNTITPELADFIARQDSIFLATASADGQPYIQHRGGPPGFLRVLDDHTLGFADYKGNRQYISQGNLTENDRVHLFLIDYTLQQRVKIWGAATAVENDADLVARLMPGGYAATPELAILIKVLAWDANCPKHIPRRVKSLD